MTYASLLPLTFFLFFFLVHTTQSKNVTVFLDDPAVITSPPDLWSAKTGYHTLSSCSVGHWLNESGQSVVLLFTGTAITITLYPHIDGSIASITMDGENVALVDTLGTEGCTSSTRPIHWISNAIAAARHNITVTARGAGSGKWISMGPFIYAAVANPSSTPGPIQEQPPTSGTIAGAVLGGVTTLAFLCMGITFIYLRRRMRLNLPVLSIIGDETLVTQTQTQTQTLSNMQFTTRAGPGTDMNGEHSRMTKKPSRRGMHMTKSEQLEMDDRGSVKLGRKPSRLKGDLAESSSVNLSRKPSRMTGVQMDPPQQIPPVPAVGTSLPSLTSNDAPDGGKSETPASEDIIEVTR